MNCELSFVHNTNLKYVLTFLRFLSVLGSVSVDDALDRGLLGTSCTDADAKLDLDAQLFHLCKCAAVVNKRCKRSRKSTIGLITHGKHERKLCTNNEEQESVGGFRCTYAENIQTAISTVCSFTYCCNSE